jgi:hypothetical protein
MFKNGDFFFQTQRGSIFFSTCLQMNESRSFVSTTKKRYCQARRNDQKKDGESRTRKRLWKTLGWLHHPDDFVGQFYLCFFHAWAAPFGGPCMKKARVKLDNRIVKTVLSNPKKTV